MNNIGGVIYVENDVTLHLINCTVLGIYSDKEHSDKKGYINIYINSVKKSVICKSLLPKLNSDIIYVDFEKIGQFIFDYYSYIKSDSITYFRFIPPKYILVHNSVNFINLVPPENGEYKVYENPAYLHDTIVYHDGLIQHKIPDYFHESLDDSIGIVVLINKRQLKETILTKPVLSNIKFAINHNGSILDVTKILNMKASN